MSVFDPTPDTLPGILPIFPLAGAIVLPDTNLPLNIFEPRYLSMISAALGDGRMIGMVQPKSGEDDEAAEAPAVFSIGCAGRIVQFEESDDGRFLINLKGVIRFKIAQELPELDGYRRVAPDWSAYHADLDGEPVHSSGEDEASKLETGRLLASLKPYFDIQGINANWDAIKDTPGERLINSLSMVCPFEPLEKQALLEATSLAERLSILTQLVEMAALETSHEESRRQ